METTDILLFGGSLLIIKVVFWPFVVDVLQGKSPSRKTKFRVGGTLVLLLAIAIADRSHLVPAWYWIEKGKERQAADPPDVDAAMQALQLALTYDPKSAVANLELGKIYFNQNEWVSAEKHLLVVLESDKDNPEATFFLGRIDFNRQNWKTAVKKFSNALLMGYDPALGYFYRAKANEHLDPQKAIHDYRRATNAKPASDKVHFCHGEAHFCRGEVHHRIEEHSEAIKAFTAAIDVNAGEVKYYIARAKAHYSLKNFEDAVADYSSALKLSPKDSHLYFQSAMCRIAADDSAGAMDHLNQAIQLDDQYVDAYMQRLFLRTRSYAIIDDATRILKIEPTNLDALFLRGCARRDRQEFDKAVLDLSKAIDLGLNKPEAFLARGESHLALEKFAKAISDLSVVIEDNSESFTALVKRARAYEKQGRVEPAIRDLSQAIECDSSKIEPLIHRGHLHVQTEKFDDAISDFTAALKLAPSKAKLKYYRAQASAAAGYHQEAVDDFGSMLEPNPDHIESRLGRAQSLAALDRHEQAIDDWTKAIHLNRNSMTAVLGRGRSRFAIRKYSEAIYDFRAAWEKDPSIQDQIRDDFANALLEQGKTTLAAAKYDDAITAFEQVKEIHPEFARKMKLHQFQARSFLFKARQSKSNNEAVAAYSRAISFDNGLITARHERALKYIDVGQLDAALSDLNDVLGREPMHVKSLVSRGKIRLKQKEHQKAILDFSAALKSLPSSVEARSGRGIAYLKVQNFSDAITDFSQLLKSEDNSATEHARLQLAQAHFQRGLRMLQEGQFSTAISDLDQAVTFDPQTNSRIRIPLARAHVGRSHEHQKNGDLASAIDHLGRALTLKPDYAEALLQRASAFRQLDKVDLENSLRDYRRLLTLDPITTVKVDALLGKGEVEIESGMLVVAVSSFDEAILLARKTTSHQRLSAAFLGRARALNHLATPTDGQLQQCVEDFRQAITISLGELKQKIAPELGTAYLRLGLKHFEALTPPPTNRQSHRGLLDYTVNELEKAKLISATLSTKVKRPLATAYSLRAEFHFVGAEYTLAIRDFRNAVSTDRNVESIVSDQLARAHFKRGVDHYKTEQWSDAIDDFRTASGLSEEVHLDSRQPHALSLVRLALSQSGTDNLETELSLLKSAANISGNLPETQKLVALLTFQSETSANDEVLRELAAAVSRAHNKSAEPIRIKSTTGYLKNRLYAALSRLRSGNCKDAVKIYAEIADQSWSNAYCFYGRGMAYLGLGENEKAVADLELASFLEFSRGGDPRFGFHFEFVQGANRLKAEEFRKRGGDRPALKQQERNRKRIDQINAVREEIDTAWDTKTILPNDTRKEKNKSRSRISSHRIRRENTVAAETGHATPPSVPAFPPAIARSSGGDRLAQARILWSRIPSRRGLHRRATQPSTSRPYGSRR